MEIQQIRYVLALAREKSFLGAAKQMHVTQPTLSQQVQKLEKELGVPLFERTPRGVLLTPAGERFLPRAAAIITAVAQGFEEVRENEGEIRGTVRLSAIPTLGPYLLPGIVKEARLKAPGLMLHLYEETTENLLASLKSTRIDLGLLSLPIKEPGLVTRSFGRERFVLAVASAHPLARKSKVTMKDLRQEKLLVLQEGHCFGDQSLEYCRRSREDAQVIFEGGSLTSVMRLAAAGEGITLVPQMAVHEGPRQGLRFIPFSDPQPGREVATVWRISAPLGRAEKLLIEIAASVFAQSTSG